MKPYQLRVVIEKAKLDYKIALLTEFIDSVPFDRIRHDEQGRMIAQFDVMEKYSEILKDRIINFA